MNGLGDLILAGAGLAGDQHRGFGMGHQGNQLEDLAHLGALADDRLGEITVWAQSGGIDDLGEVVKDNNQPHRFLAVIAQAYGEGAWEFCGGHG